MDFRSQKGATGADVMIAATVIMIVIGIVSMIYVNTTLQSRNVTRTAGATRIATNILENIEKISYDEFATTYNSVKGATIPSIDTYTSYPTLSGTVFNTKIPNGYTVYLYGEPNYGSHTSALEQFDLTRDIKLVVTYKVGDVIEKVEFSTSKKREIVGEVNEPDTSILGTQGFLNVEDVDQVFYPIKYSDTAKSYVRTTENDQNWYNYSNKRWAMVLVAPKSIEENNIFDANGALKSSIESDESVKKYVWIPRFYYNSDINKFTEFAYLTVTDKARKELALTSNKDNTKPEGKDTVELRYITCGNKNNNLSGENESKNVTDMKNSSNSALTGIWIEADGTSTNNDYKNYYNLLNNSKYGPCELH